MMPRRSKLCCVLMLVCLAAVLLAPHVASACPTCKDGMEANDPEHAGMVQGYFYSILFMMSMPYILLSSFGLYMYREVKKARRNEAAAKASAASSNVQPTSQAAEALPSASPERKRRELQEA